MSILVVDASVAVKWYVPEINHELASRLLDDRYELHAPDLLPSEFGNTLWKKFRAKELSSREVTAIVRAIGKVPLEIHPSLTLLEGATEIAIRTARTVYDSLYVALAVTLDRPLVTADARLVNALKSSPLSSYVRHVADFESLV